MRTSHRDVSLIQASQWSWQKCSMLKHPLPMVVAPPTASQTYFLMVVAPLAAAHTHSAAACALLTAVLSYSLIPSVYLEQVHTPLDALAMALSRHPFFSACARGGRSFTYVVVNLASIPASVLHRVHFINPVYGIMNLPVRVERRVSSVSVSTSRIESSGDVNFSGDLAGHGGRGRFSDRHPRLHQPVQSSYSSASSRPAPSPSASSCSDTHGERLVRCTAARHRRSFVVLNSRPPTGLARVLGGTLITVVLP